MIMIKDLLTLRLALYITVCTDKPTHLPVQTPIAQGRGKVSICVGYNQKWALLQQVLLKTWQVIYEKPNHCFVMKI